MFYNYLLMSALFGCWPPPPPPSPPVFPQNSVTLCEEEEKKKKKMPPNEQNQNKKAKEPIVSAYDPQNQQVIKSTNQTFD